MIETMFLRNYQESDKIALESLFKSHNFDYTLPEANGDDILCALVLEEDGQIRAAAILRLEVNCFLLLDHKWGTPQERWEALQVIHEMARQKAENAGINEANCWPPPEIEKSFSDRLEALGWRQNLWNSYSRRVKEG